ncbi:hypothetical protein ABT213_02745 [Streptomyces sp. NPDC001674]|uniref:hypothetical protein n=1 Tax=unclassified Streptomyces TaxID=2593676 RepID=UPI00331E5902
MRAWPARKVPGTAVVVVVALLLAGCGLRDLRETDPAAAPSAEALPSFAVKAPVPPGKPLDGGAKVTPPPAPDQSDATAVARTWLATLYSYDTAYDTGPQDARLRAAGYLTDKKAEAERSFRGVSGTGGEWATWAEHQAWTSVEVIADEEGQGPGDTPAAAFRTFTVDGTAQGRDGWKGPGPRLTAVVELTLTGPGTWRVAGVSVIPAAAPPSPVPPTTPPAR